jgi:hypothetical protein
VYRTLCVVIIPVYLFLLIGCGGGGGSTSSGSGGNGSNGNPVTTPVALTVTPTTASVAVGGTQSFSATVINTTQTGVTWSVREGVTGGTINSSGIYTAPNTIGTYHVVATSQADSTKTVTVAVTVHTLVVITPATVTLTVGATQTFTATVTGSTTTGVNWGVLEAAPGAAISATGTYTAPTAPGTYHITATSQIDGTQATATVIVQAAQPGSAVGTIH